MKVENGTFPHKLDNYSLPGHAGVPERRGGIGDSRAWFSGSQGSAACWSQGRKTGLGGSGGLGGAPPRCSAVLPEKAVESPWGSRGGNPGRVRAVEACLRRSPPTPQTEAL